MALTDSKAPRPALWAAICALIGLALVLHPGPAAAVAKAPASASKAGKAGTGPKRTKHSRRVAARRAVERRRARIRRLQRTHKRGHLSVANAVAIGSRRKKAAAPASGFQGVIDAGFENGLFNWNTAGVGDAIPSVTGSLVRSGSAAGRFALGGGQERSELILGGDGGRSANDTIRFYEGAEAYYAFSFYIEQMVYGRPGGHNLIMQLKGDDDGSPNLGLQLWDYEGDDGHSGGRGLWSHSSAMGGDRYLSPVPERRWHDVVVHFRASSNRAGLYEVYLNGRLIDSRSRVNTIPSDADYVYIKSGIYRNPDTIPGTSILRLDAVRLGPSLDSVIP